MKIERISASQIRCTLSNFDLSERNLKISELAYGNEKARRLFREMMQKASAEFGFEAEDLPLMVEAIPLSNESVILLITKVDDPEEMDTRFSRFAPPPENELSPSDPELPDSGLESSDLPSPAPSAGQEAEPLSGRTRSFSFSSLDQVIDAARAVANRGTSQQLLYKNPANGHYYLVLKEEASEREAFSALCNQLTEYGAGVRCSASGDSYFREHYELILKERVLESLAGI